MLVTRHFCAQTASDFSTQLTTLARPEHNHVIQRKRSFNFLPSFTLSPLSQSVLQKQKDNRKMVKAVACASAASIADASFIADHCKREESSCYSVAFYEAYFPEPILYTMLCNT